MNTYTLLYAQSTLAVKAGANFARYQFEYGSAVPVSQQIPTYPFIFPAIGVLLEIPLTNYFALQTEVNFIQKGFLASPSLYTTSKVTVNWLETPFLAKIKFKLKEGTTGSVFFGPSLGYGLGIRIRTQTTVTINGKTTKETKDKSQSFTEAHHNQLDFSWNFGGEISNQNFFLDARYQLGMSNMITHSPLGSYEEKAYNRNFIVTVGYRLPFKL